MKFSFAILLFISLVLSSSVVQLSLAKAIVPPATVPPPSPAPLHPSFCDRKCAARCAKAGVKDRCLAYCGICCRDCKCVPSGTFGHKSECPCYRDKLNSKGHPKCP